MLGVGSSGSDLSWRTASWVCIPFRSSGVALDPMDPGQTSHLALERGSLDEVSQWGVGVYILVSISVVFVAAAGAGAPTTMLKSIPRRNPPTPTHFPRQSFQPPIPHPPLHGLSRNFRHLRPAIRRPRHDFPLPFALLP